MLSEHPACFPETVMPSLILNGERRKFPAAVHDIAHLVDTLGYAGKRIAIEQNGAIVPKSRYADTPLADGDTLEIVVAVGGG
jgi:sulfur carrier protein